MEIIENNFLQGSWFGFCNSMMMQSFITTSYSFFGWDKRVVKCSHCKNRKPICNIINTWLTYDLYGELDNICNKLYNSIIPFVIDEKIWAFNFAIYIKEKTK